jgi:hypothetical protein
MFDLSFFKIAIAFSFVLGIVSIYELVLESNTASNTEHINETSNAISK